MENYVEMKEILTKNYRQLRTIVHRRNGKDIHSI